MKENGSLNDFYQIANFAGGLRSLTSRDKPAALFWLFSLYTGYAETCLKYK